MAPIEQRISQKLRDHFGKLGARPWAHGCMGEQVHAFRPWSHSLLPHNHASADHASASRECYQYLLK